MPLSADFAPVVVFCYNRPNHLRQTIEALKLNTIASQSRLIIFSDGAKNARDEINVKEIRSYIHTIDGFLVKEIFESQNNKGLAASVIEGVSNVVASYKKVIVLEDDMVCTPDFLSFMNEALASYESRLDIFSVTGYAPPVLIPENYKNDLFLAPRASSWGWATWQNRWEKADWDVKNFKEILKESSLRKKITQGGEDLWPMLVKQQRGIINSWAVRWTVSQSLNDAYGVYPVISKIKNIGTDGSGTNFTFGTTYYNSELNTKKINIDPDLKPDQSVIKSFNHYYRLPLLLKIKNWFKYKI